MSSNLSAELEVALRAAKRAQQVIMAHYRPGVAVRLKEDGTPVTQADLEAESAIIETIRDRFPDHGFLGEETGGGDAQVECVWVLDPVDGTSNFARGIPLFATQIALLRNGHPVLGVSNAPALGELLYGDDGQGAYLNGDRVHVSSVSDLAEAHISVGGLEYFIAAGEMDSLVRVMAAAGRVRGFGDAYAYHLVATGRCEAVVETGVRIWDIAALSAIVREAGGECTDIRGNQITLDTRDVICSNGLVHQHLVELLARAS
jgi:histidinol-phosphatase